MQPTKKAKTPIRRINISVSPEAHKAMVKKAVSMTPRLNLREYINFMNNLPLEK